ncbi:hypothetical protein LHK_02445 [Laribacter hongkongensis HLHK9]|uniref:Uncharacterized protein n=1 Tax=Laribacter hongkongensis (strain HLHK9) TaxID=557598 RepID=C1DB88_LARHH|nr:hypothetical protein LHK_02445 [Laribacter hongkongensis HLHK9]
MKNQTKIPIELKNRRYAFLNSKQNFNGIFDAKRKWPF